MSNYKIRIAAKCFCFDQKDRLLLVMGQKKSLFGEYWATPGGGVEEGEAFTTTAAREVLEETGYSVKVGKLVFAQDYTIKKAGGRNFEVFFVGEVDSSVKPEEIHDHEFAWFTEEEFSKLSFRPEGVNPFALRQSEGIEYETYLK